MAKRLPMFSTCKPANSNVWPKISGHQSQIQAQKFRQMKICGCKACWTRSTSILLRRMRERIIAQVRIEVKALIEYSSRVARGEESAPFSSGHTHQEGQLQAIFDLGQDEDATG